jgi:hypothetical protein
MGVGANHHGQKPLRAMPFSKVGLESHRSRAMPVERSRRPFQVAALEYSLVELNCRARAHPSNSSTA